MNPHGLRVGDGKGREVELAPEDLEVVIRCGGKVANTISRLRTALEVVQSVNGIVGAVLESTENLLAPNAEREKGER